MSGATQVQALRKALNEDSLYFKNRLEGDLPIVRDDLRGDINDTLLRTLHSAATTKDPDLAIPNSIPAGDIYLGKAHTLENASVDPFSDKPLASEASVPVSMTRQELIEEVKGKVDLYTQLAAKLTPEWAQGELAKLGQIVNGAVTLIQSRNELAKGCHGI